MFGIANKNYMKRPDSDSYLGQQSHLREHKGTLLGHVQELLVNFADFLFIVHAILLFQVHP